MNCNLMELDYSGCKHTWDDGSVKSRLDKVMINLSFLENFPNAAVNFLNLGCLSNHSPCIFQFLPIVQGAYSFKLFNMWAEHVDFISTVMNFWNEDVYGTAMYRLCKKLKRLKHYLKVLNKQAFSDITSRVVKAVRELDNLQDLCKLSSSSDDIKARVGPLKKAVFGLLNAERLFFSQMAKGHFLNISDRNSKYCHAIIKRNIARRSISSIQLYDGSVTTCMNQVKDHFILHLPPAYY